MIATFVVVRAFLHTAPDTDFNVSGYNVHHLFVGLLLIALFGPIVVIRQSGVQLARIAVVGFGVGLSLALDEWLYLIVTDGSNASYLLPESFWGGLVLIGAVSAYALFLASKDS